MKNLLMYLGSTAATLLVIVSGLVDPWMPWAQQSTSDSMTSAPRVLYLDLAQLAGAYPEGNTEGQNIAYMQEVQRMLIELTAEGYIIIDSEAVIYADEALELNATTLMDAAATRINRTNGGNN